MTRFAGSVTVLTDFVWVSDEDIGTLFQRLGKRTMDYVMDKTGLVIPDCDLRRVQLHSFQVPERIWT